MLEAGTGRKTWFFPQGVAKNARDGEPPCFGHATSFGSVPGTSIGYARQLKFSATTAHLLPPKLITPCRDRNGTFCVDRRARFIHNRDLCSRASFPSRAPRSAPRSCR